MLQGQHELLIFGYKVKDDWNFQSSSGSQKNFESKFLKLLNDTVATASTAVDEIKCKHRDTKLPLDDFAHQFDSFILYQTSDQQRDFKRLVVAVSASALNHSYLGYCNESLIFKRTPLDDSTHECMSSEQASIHNTSSTPVM